MAKDRAHSVPAALFWGLIPMERRSEVGRRPRLKKYHQSSSPLFCSWKCYRFHRILAPNVILGRLR